jgi:eukaryotic-like serine/threonine-protein kinase
MDSHLTRIGKYEIQGELGRGGFGRVYKGFDPTVNRVVAIKVLLPEATEAEFLTRFKIEASTTGNLHHPNLVTIHEFGEEGNLHYLVMEFLEGEDLQKIISQKRPLMLLDKVEIMQQVAAGLHSAHQKGVIHRDVKPSNIMVLKDGGVKLMDFGIARLTRNDTTRVTRAGMLVGTMNYMSPEQFRDGEVDALCDIWAFGVIYYEFLTGRSPFDGSTTPALIYGITSVEPPPVSALLPECPESLSYMIMRTLAKDRDLRYQSLEEFQLDVGPILMDLRQKRAGELLPEAQSLLSAGQTDEAMKLVRRILDLDPMQAEARQLRERIQREAQQQAIVPKIQAFRKAGEEMLSQRRYAEAIQQFESALRLDTGNTELQGLLDQARGAVDQFKKAQEFADQAARELNSEQFSAAHELVTLALQADPLNPRAREVMARVQQSLDSRERREAIEQAAEKARAHLAAKHIDEAMETLIDARTRLHSPPELLPLIQQAEAARAARDLRIKRESVLKQSADLLRAGRAAEAESLLTELRQETGADAELDKRIAEAAAASELEIRRERVEKVVDRVHVLEREEEFDRAGELVRRALEEYPGDAALEEAARELEGARNRFENRKQIEQALRRARDLRTAGELAAARELLAAARRDYGSAKALEDLESEIDGELRARESRQAAGAIAADARELIKSSEWSQAKGVLAEALKKYPGDAELAALLESVERGLTEEEARREKDEAYQKAMELRARGDLEGARAAITEARARLHDTPLLNDLEREIEKELRVRGEREQIHRTAEAARGMIAQARWAEARDSLRQALAAHPGEPELAALLESVDRGLAEQQRRQLREQALGAAKKLEGEGRDAEALSALDAALKQMAGDPELFSARAALAMRSSERQKAGDLSARVDRVRRAMETGDFALAQRELEEAARMAPADPLVVRAGEDLAVRKRMAEVDAAARNIGLAIESEKLDEAAQMLRESMRHHPGDARLMKLQQALEGERVFLDALRIVEQHLGNRRLDLAASALRSAGALRPDSDKLRKLSQRIDKEREKLASEREAALKKVQSLTQKNSFDEAGKLVRELLERNPDDGDAVRALDALNAARGAHMKRQNYSARINDLESKRKAGNAQAVKEGAALLLAEFPGDVQARNLLAWSEQKLHDIADKTLQKEVPATNTGWKAGVAVAGVLVVALTGWIIYRGGSEGAASWSVSAKELSFKWKQGESLPEAKQIALSSARGVVSVKASSGAPWLNVDPASATTPGQFAVGVVPAGLAPGDYKATITLETDQAEPKKREIAVTFTLTGREQPAGNKSGPSLLLDTELLSFEVRQDAAASDAKVVRVRGNGVSGMRASARSRGNWLRVSPGAGGLPAALSVQVSPAGLAPGTYQGEIAIAGDGANVTQSVPVSLRVREAEKTQQVQQQPPPQPPPAVVEPKKQDPPPPVLPPKPEGTYAGLLRGTITWVGELGPGQKLTLTNEGLADGPGNARGQYFPGNVAISVEVPTAGIKVDAAPSAGDRYSRMVISNTSGAAVPFIQIRWRVVQ